MLNAETGLDSLGTSNTNLPKPEQPALERWGPGKQHAQPSVTNAADFPSGWAQALESAIPFCRGLSRLSQPAFPPALVQSSLLLCLYPDAYIWGHVVQKQVSLNVRTVKGMSVCFPLSPSLSANWSAHMMAGAEAASLDHEGEA